MANYVLNWLQTHFRLVGFRNDEALITCPACGKDKLYFNVRKKVGFCHYDSCSYHLKAVTVQMLTNVCGFAPDEQIVYHPNIRFNSWDVPSPIVDLPKEAEPIIRLHNGEMQTIFPTAVNHLIGRFITLSDIYKFNMHFDGLRVYVPVYSDGKMVQWVGRAAWWFEHGEKKYKYASGAPVTNYLFNWDTHKKKNHVALVENTFVSIALSSRVKHDSGAVSTFGSNLSEEQIRLLIKGEAESVVIVFDRDAIDKAAQGLKKLRDKGMRAGLLKLTLKQPDEYSYFDLGNSIDFAHYCLCANNDHWVFELDMDGKLHNAEL